MQAHTTSGVVGYASRATADKGHAVLVHLVRARLDAGIDAERFLKLPLRRRNSPYSVMIALT
jgi:hypothetical protein